MPTEQSEHVNSHLFQSVSLQTNLFLSLTKPRQLNAPLLLLQYSDLFLENSCYCLFSKYCISAKDVLPRVWKLGENWGSRLLTVIVNFNNDDSLWYSEICGTIDSDIV